MPVNKSKWSVWKTRLPATFGAPSGCRFIDSRVSETEAASSCMVATFVDMSPLFRRLWKPQCHHPLPFPCGPLLSPRQVLWVLWAALLRGRVRWAWAWEFFRVSTCPLVCFLCLCQMALSFEWQQIQIRLPGWLTKGRSGMVSLCGRGHLPMPHSSGWRLN